MRNDCWEALLKHIPADLQNQYMIVTSSGVEIAVQNFLRVEREVLVFKGRLSGSQDQGILFFLPYARIDYVGTSKLVKDTEFAETYGSFTFPEATPEPPPPPPVLEPPAKQAEPAPVNPSARPAAVEAKPSIRSEVLERFRSRSSGSSLNFPQPPQQP